MKTGNK